MIYFTLRGGLANMMFQIAAVNSIALSKNTHASFGNLEQQLTYLNNETHFNPHLNHSSEYKNLTFFKGMLTEKAPAGIKVYSYPFHYSDIKIDGDTAMLDGFFQSEKYFKKHEKKIREIFQPTEEIIKIINEKYKHILKEKTTSIHVRRGDYVRNQVHHPVQTLDYYKKGIDILKKDTNKYIIFSDDIQWCKKTFQGDEFIFIENEKDYIELYLMSMCDYNIIANSSFSWWGAWLNNNKNKVVIGPKNWLGIAYKNTFNTYDILPDEWIKI
jgi:hypothetical protein